MRIFEIMARGLGGSDKVIRYPFQPGLNAWRQKGPARLGLVVGLLERLLYPEPGGETWTVDGVAVTAAGMTFEAGETTYRLTHSREGKRWQLAERAGEASADFRDLSDDPRFIAEFLLRSVRIPSSSAFQRLFVARPGLQAKEGRGEEAGKAEKGEGSSNAEGEPQREKR